MNEERFDALTEELLEKECFVLDILPRQVGAERSAAWFAAEDFFLKPERRRALYEKFASVLIKLSCYYDLALCADGVWAGRPGPDTLWERVAGCGETGWCNILLPEEEALIALRGGDLYLTVYHPSAALSDDIRQLAAGEGLYYRRGV